MQRIALGVCVILAALAGCAKPTGIKARPLPDPLLRTHHPPRHVVIPAQPPRLPDLRARRPGVAAAELDERELLPPGGIKRGQWRVIVVHHSANEGDTPESMDDYHRDVRGWSNGLGYHFVIGNGVKTDDGRVYVGPRWERQISGAHCRSKSGRYFGRWRASNFFNAHGIGICLIGNFEDDRPTPRQVASLHALLAFLCSQTGIDPAHVYGHCDVTGKTLCPGQFLHARLPQVRAAVAQTLAASDAGPPRARMSGPDDHVAARPDANSDRAPLSADARLEGR